MEIRIAVPRVPTGLLANLLGLLGLLGVALAVGGLTGSWWWSALVGGVFSVGLSYVAQTHATAPAADAVEDEARPRLVAAARTA